jgi:predicted nuclease of predicted toxin-antitoxin system
VRLLVDANLAPIVAARLRDAGHDALHVVEIGLHSASDVEILDRAAADDRVVVSSDSDFGAILARRGQAKPSFVLLRHRNELTPGEQAELLVANLSELVAELEAGAVVTFTRSAIRLRRLPFDESR